MLLEWRQKDNPYAQIVELAGQWSNGALADDQYLRYSMFIFSKYLILQPKDLDLEFCGIHE